MSTHRTSLFWRLALLFVINISCSQKPQGEQSMMSTVTGDYDLANEDQMAVVHTPNTNSGGTLIPAVADTVSKIIRNAESKIKVGDIEKAIQQAKKIAAHYQGYVADERYTRTNYTNENSLTIRVPNTAFETTLDSICALAEFVEYKNISTTDVTEKYVDIASRLQAKLEVKERYVTILRTNVKTVEDILNTEEKISELQGDIEAAQGKLKYLDHKIRYSTIQLEMYDTVIPAEEPHAYAPGFIDKAKDGLSFGWTLLENIFLLFFYIWPLFLLGILIFIYFKWIRKRRK